MIRPRAVKCSITFSSSALKYKYVKYVYSPLRQKTNTNTECKKYNTTKKPQYRTDKTRENKY